MSRPDVEESAKEARGLWGTPPPTHAAAYGPVGEAARTEALLDGVLAGAGGPAVILDTRGRIERINKSATRHTGLRAGDPFLERLVGPEDLQAAIHEEVRQGTPISFFTSPGLEWRTFPIRDGGRLLGTAVFADV